MGKAFGWKLGYHFRVFITISNYHSKIVSAGNGVKQVSENYAH